MRKLASSARVPLFDYGIGLGDFEHGIAKARGTK
jgi:hypothetical protein